MLCGLSATHLTIFQSKDVVVFCQQIQSLVLILIHPGFETQKFDLLKEYFSPLLDGQSGSFLFSPSVGSKGTYHPTSHYCVRDLIGCNHLSHSGPFGQDDGVIFGVVQLDISLLASTAVCAVARSYVQLSRQSLIILM